MQNKKLPFLALILLAGCSSGGGAANTDTEAAAPAQQPAQALTNGSWRLSPGERVRVSLSAGVIYRAEVDGNGATLDLRPRLSGVQLPQIQELVGGTGVTGTRVYTIKPYADAEYEITTRGGDMSQPADVRLFRTSQ